MPSVTANEPPQRDPQRPARPSTIPHPIRRLATSPVVGGSILAGLVLAAFADRKLLWFDEAITYYLAGLGSPRRLWEALAHGADNNPPLYHLAAQATTSFARSSRLALRLPAMLGYLALCAAASRFVGWRAPAPYAWAAWSLPFATVAPLYAIEARPYGLVLGGLGLAIVAYQAAADRGRAARTWPLLAVAIGLASAVSSHYFSVLLVVPFAVAEAVRLRATRRLDVPLGMALATGLLPLLGFRPLIAALEPYKQIFWARPGVWSIPGAYAFVLGPAGIGVVFWFLLVLVVAFRGRRNGRPPVGSGWPGHEWALAMALSFYPVLAFGLAVGVTGVLADRYSLPTVAGLALLVPLTLDRWSHGRRWPAIAVIAGSFAAGAFTLATDPIREAWRYQTPEQLAAPLAATGASSGPVAMWDPIMYLPMTVALGPNEHSRLVALLEGPPNTSDQILRSLAPYAGLRVVPYERFLADRGYAPFLFLYRNTESRPTEWIRMAPSFTVYSDRFWTLEQISPFTPQ